MSKNIIRLSKIVPLGFGSMFLLMISIGFATKYSMDNLAEAIKLQTHTYVVKTNLQGLEKQLVDAETGQRGFIFTGKEEFLEPYKNGTIAFYKTAIETKMLIKDNPEQVKNMAQLETMTEQKLDGLAETISLKREGKESQLRALVLSKKGKIVMDEIRAKLHKCLI